MKKLTILIVFIVLALVAVTMLAAGPSDKAGKSDKAHLYLYEKDPSTWEIVEDGAWGKLTYNSSGSMFDYVFNGHGLVAGTNYTLIYYPDPWPGTGLKCLGSGVVNEEGNVHIKNSVDTGDLPMASDENTTGAKIWLVKSSDVDCEGVTWSVVGDWTWLVLGTFEHDIVITSQNPDGTFTGTGGYPAGGPYSQVEAITGVVTGNQITLTTVYTPGPYTVTAMGTINPDGTMDGTNPWGWEMTTGNAVSITGKMIGWNPTEYLFEEVLITFDDTDV